MKIPFSKALSEGSEEKYVLEVLKSGHWHGRGPTTLKLEEFTSKKLEVKHAIFVTSGSAALEIGCMLANLGPGDEVILPSFSFSSAANAIIRAGGTPVFVDIDAKTWNISAQLVEQALTNKTKAVLNVHYAGSPAGSIEIRKLCRAKNLFFIEDAAQSLGSKINNKFVGPSEWVNCFSLHGTKNITSGEGGFVTTDNDELAEQIEIIIEKGTNRQNFIRGQVDKYTWVGLGSSFVPSDLLAAVGLAQVEKLEDITHKRVKIWNQYADLLKNYSVQIQKFEQGTSGNGHIMAYLVPKNLRNEILDEYRKEWVGATFHFIPLHSSPMGRKYKSVSNMEVTDRVSNSLIRLPIYNSMTSNEVERVCEVTNRVLRKFL